MGDREEAFGADSEMTRSNSYEEEEERMGGKGEKEEEDYRRGQRPGERRVRLRLNEFFFFFLVSF